MLETDDELVDDDYEDNDAEDIVSEEMEDTTPEAEYSGSGSYDEWYREVYPTYKDQENINLTS